LCVSVRVGALVLKLSRCPEQVWKGCRQLRDSFGILSLN
jgi:hypothetical protein